MILFSVLIPSYCLRLISIHSQHSICIRWNFVLAETILIYWNVSHHSFLQQVWPFPLLSQGLIRLKTSLQVFIFIFRSKLLSTACLTKVYHSITILWNVFLAETNSNYWRNVFFMMRIFQFLPNSFSSLRYLPMNMALALLASADHLMYLWSYLLFLFFNHFNTALELLFVSWQYSVCMWWISSFSSSSETYVCQEGNHPEFYSLIISWFLTKISFAHIFQCKFLISFSCAATIKSFLATFLF